MRFQHEFFAFLAQASFYIDSIWFRLFAETRLALYNWVYSQMSIYLSYLPCPRQLSRCSSHAANGKLASFSAASCWCGVILNLTISTSQHSVWWHSDSDGRLLAFYDQFIKDDRGSQVPAHWCFYERTGEREMGYKRLMIVCRRSSASNDNTWCSEQLTWLCQRDAAPDRDSPSVTSPYSLYTENYTGDTEYTAGTLFKLKLKL